MAQITQDVIVPRSTVLPIFLNHADIWTEVENRSWIFEVTDPERGWNASDFSRVVAGLRAIPDIKQLAHPDTLEVIAEEGKNAGFVLDVKESNQISRYCYAESPNVVPHEFNSRIVRIKEHLCPEFPLSISSMVRDNRKVAVASEIGPAWNEVPKLYFLKKEFVFVDEGAHVQYVIRLARNVIQSFMAMKESDVTRRPVEYEMTMEVLPSIKKTSMSPEQRASHLLTCVLRLVLALRQEPVVVTTKMSKDVIQGYKSLISAVVPKPRTFPGPKGKQAPSAPSGGAPIQTEAVDETVAPGNNDNERAADAAKADLYLLAPKPVTLEKHHLSEPGSGYGVITVLTGYAVTDKADGERMLMYVDSDGSAYLIDNSLDVKAMGQHTTRKDLCNSLIDGEFVPMEDGPDLFCAFDAYFVNGQPIMRLPLITESPTKQSRYGKLKSMFESGNWKSMEPSVELRVKTHIAAEGNEMFAACRKMLDMSTNDLPYQIDGLIFTPTALPVFGTYENGPVSVPRGAKWERVFKWKPSDQNTIDFLVKKVGTPCGLSITDRFQKFELFTGYNANAVEPVKTWTGIMMRYDYKSFKNSDQMKDRMTYKARSFRPEPNFGKSMDVEFAYFPIDANGRVLAMNGDVISDDDIVEVGFDASKRGAYRWFPLRVRYDKVKKYKKLNSLSGNVNDYSTAMNIWRSIHNPVTKEMIIGETRAALPSAGVLEEATLGSENVYYDKQVQREHSLSLNMLQFHTHGIKGMLYNRVKDKRSLLELACGKAGDLNRWWDAGLQFVLGVDLVKDNIQNPQDGAYMRLRRRNLVMEKNEQNVPTKYFNAVFAVGDVAKPLHDGSAASGVDEESVKLLKLLYGRSMKGVPNADRIASVLGGRARDKFDAVSIQFAIHYMFENEKLLDGLLQNVADNLKDGGVFFGTCMDGVLVHKALQGSASGIIEGRKGIQGSGNYPIWAILRKYGEADVFDAKPENAFGKRVDVFLEMTDNLIPEYLVNFDTLVAKCKRFGLVLANVQKDTGIFISEYDAYLKKNPDMEMDAVQKQFSFFNRWFVFTKRTKVQK
jgi:SAM-dependent methyltransferase